MAMALTTTSRVDSAPFGTTVLTGPPMATALTLPFVSMSLTASPIAQRHQLLCGNGVNGSPHSATASTVPYVATASMDPPMV